MLSVVIPVYNGEKYISKCFECLLKQTFTDFEVIIINDGSTDNSNKIIREYVLKDKRFRCYSQSNKGQSAARNIGIQMAKGEYITFVDCDDILENEYFAKLYSAQKHGADIGFCAIKRLYEGKFILEHKFNYINYVHTDLINIFDNPSLFTKIAVGPVAKIIKRDFLIRNNIFFKTNYIYEDVLFTQQMFANNPKIESIDDTNYLYYVHKQSSLTSKSNKINDIFTIFDELIEYAKNKNVYGKFFLEYEYLAVYHIAIGTVYRLFRWKPLSLFAHIKKCKSYLFKNKFSIHNKYIHNMNLILKTYLRIFFN